jgi:hypothetical protein
LTVIAALPFVPPLTGVNDVRVPRSTNITFALLALELGRPFGCRAGSTPVGRQ